MLDSNARVRSSRGVRFATKCNTRFVELNLGLAGWSRIPYKLQGQSHTAVRRKHSAQGWVACGDNTRDAVGSLCRSRATCVSVLLEARDEKFQQSHLCFLLSITRSCYSNLWLESSLQWATNTSEFFDKHPDVTLWGGLMTCSGFSKKQNTRARNSSVLASQREEVIALCENHRSNESLAQDDHLGNQF